MKKIKFRGKSKETNEWVCGQLLYLDNQPFVVGNLVEANDEYTTVEWWQPVHPNSVGQFTGLKDFRGVEIYVNDVLDFSDFYYDGSDVLCRGEVIFENGSYHLTNSCTESQLYEYEEEDLSVIGNIYDNPELPKEETE